MELTGHSSRPPSYIPDKFLHENSFVEDYQIEQFAKTSQRQPQPSRTQTSTMSEKTKKRPLEEKPTVKKVSVSDGLDDWDLGAATASKKVPTTEEWTKIQHQANLEQIRRLGLNQSNGAKKAKKAKKNDDEEAFDEDDKAILSTKEGAPEDLTESSRKHKEEDEKDLRLAKLESKVKLYMKDKDTGEYLRDKNGNKIPFVAEDEDDDDEEEGEDEDDEEYEDEDDDDEGVVDEDEEDEENEEPQLKKKRAKTEEDEEEPEESQNGGTKKKKIKVEEEEEEEEEEEDDVKKALELSRLEEEARKKRRAAIEESQLKEALKRSVSDLPPKIAQKEKEWQERTKALEEPEKVPPLPQFEVEANHEGEVENAFYKEVETIMLGILQSKESYMQDEPFLSYMRTEILSVLDENYQKKVRELTSSQNPNEKEKAQLIVDNYMSWLKQKSTYLQNIGKAINENNASKIPEVLITALSMFDQLSTRDSKGTMKYRRMIHSGATIKCSITGQDIKNGERYYIVYLSVDSISATAKEKIEGWEPTALIEPICPRAYPFMRHLTIIRLWKEYIKTQIESAIRITRFTSSTTNEDKAAFFINHVIWMDYQYKVHNAGMLTLAHIQKSLDIQD
jgi:hypothetical protein